MSRIRPLIGVALAVHNRQMRTRECLEALVRSEAIQMYIVVVDDGSEDGTWDMLADDYPQIVRLRGDGTLWWAGATNWAICNCLERECEGVVLLNPDVIVEPDTIAHLVFGARALGEAIVAPIVLDHDEPTRVWEAGHRWEPIVRQVPLVWASRYLYARGTQSSELPKDPYPTVSVVGRGGYLPRRAFEELGMFDERRFPHYGGDADMSLRARRRGYPMYVIPRARVYLHTEDTGRGVPHSLADAVIGYKRYLISRRNGEAIRVLYHYTRNNLPLICAVPTYLLMLAVNSARYWQQYAEERRKTRRLG